MDQERTITYTIKIPDNYIDLTKEEVSMLYQLIRSKMDYSSNSEKEILYSLLEKLDNTNRYFSKIERTKSSYY